MKITAKQQMFGIDNEYYVYLLIDPRDNAIFYIGKGKGNRVSSHVKNSLKGKIDNVKKYQRIIDIYKAGFEVITEKPHEYLSQSEAYRIERELISEYKQAGITNIKGGVVTNKELSKQRALDLLARIKPFDKWIQDIDEDIKKFAINKYGSLYQCWQSFKNELIFLVNKNANA